MINKYSGLGMDIYRAEFQNGTQIIQFPYGDYKENQQFEFIPVSSNGTPTNGSSTKSPFETENTYRVVYNYSGYSFENSTIPKPDIAYFVKEEKIEASKQRILETAKMTNSLGGYSIVYHAAFYMGKDKETIEQAMRETEALDVKVDKWMTCHCTGAEAQQMWAERFKVVNVGETVVGK